MLKPTLLILIGILVVGCNLVAEPPTSTPGAQTMSCEAIVSAAIESADAACGSLGSNQACYGNTLLLVEPQGEAELDFNNPGDTADLLSVRRLSASAINQTSGVWGVAVVRAQANIPNTLAGQNVTFLLFGETTLDNVTPAMNTVVLSTGGIGQVECTDAPPSALLMQSPDGIPVTINFNGAEIALSSTLYLTAVQNGDMTIGVVEGSATVTALGTSQTVPEGMQTRIQLGTDDGLHVITPPSAPEPFTLNLVGRALLTLLETGPATPPAPQTAVPTVTSIPPTRQAFPTQAGCVLRSDWPATYIVQQGDTLSTIARLYNVTVAQLQQANCLVNPNNIVIGLPLRVPFIRPTNTVGPTLTPTSTPTPPPTFTPTAPPKLTDTPRPIPLPTDTPEQPSFTTG